MSVEPDDHASAPSMKSSPTSMNSTAGKKSERKLADRIARKIISSYPATGDLQEGYVLALTEHLEQYPPWVLDLLAHPQHGIAAKCKFVPAIAEVADFANDKLRREEEMARGRLAAEHRASLKPLSMDDYHRIRTGREAKYQPFPKVWDAFRDDPEAYAKLNSNLLTFEVLSGISKTLAMQGQTAARENLLNARLSDPARGHTRETPRWLTHPDPDAPWRKQGPPSRELAKLLADDSDYQANLTASRATAGAGKEGSE